MGCLVSCFGSGNDPEKAQRDMISAAEARQKAADAAQLRQEQFEKSAAGRAAKAQIAAQAKQSSNQNKGGPVLKWQMG